MKLPIINLVPGVGYGYANAGPTHYSNEDLGLANLIVGSNIYTASDAKISKLLTTNPFGVSRPIFVIDFLKSSLSSAF